MSRIERGSVDNGEWHGELVDVEVYIYLGMTCKEARAFARFLDDEMPSGYGSGHLASLIMAKLNKTEQRRVDAATQANEMIAKFREGRLWFKDGR